MSHEERLRTGGPAFAASSDGSLQTGMTLRDWFAGQALAGWMANKVTKLLVEEQDTVRASRCFQLADAMLAARKAGGE